MATPLISSLPTIETQQKKAMRTSPRAQIGLKCNNPVMTSSPAAQSTVSRRELYTVFAGLMLALTLASLDQNIVNTALPRIVSDLGGLAHLSWVVTAFMVTSTVSTPLYGKLSDIYGRKRLYYV